MKLTFVLLTAAFLNVSAIGISQNVSFSGQNVPLTKVFDEVKKQTGYVITYTESVLAGTRPVSLQIKNIPLEEFLKKLLADQPISYLIDAKTILLVRKSIRSDRQITPGTDIFSITDALITVRGKVVDGNGDPIEGVNVVIRGRKNGTVTDANGVFSIEAKPHDVLVISSVEYEEKVFEINGRENVLIELQLRIADMDSVDVVLNTGFQSVAKERATGSFVKVDNKLFNRRVSANVLDRLEGVTSGLLFDKNAGNPLGISIRGRSTINANTQPLVIVDNFPYTGDINAINPNDVESITVLKDAAAASIWGALSGNGVIVITMKKGRYNKPLNVSFNTNFTISRKPDLYYSRDFLNAGEYIEIEKMLYEKGFYDQDIANTLKPPPLSPVVELLHAHELGGIDDAKLNSEINRLKQYDVRDEYNKYLYRNSFNQQYALNVSGGSGNFNYYLALNYDDNITEIKRNAGNRVTFNSSFSFLPVKGLELTGGLVMTKMKTYLNGIEEVSSFGRYIYPYAQLADEQGNHLPVIYNLRLPFAQNPSAEGLLDWTYTPLDELALKNNVSSTLDNRLFANIKYNMVKGLTLEFKYQYQKGSTEVEEYNDPASFYVRDMVNRFSVVTDGQVTKRNVPLGGILSSGTDYNMSNSGRLQLSYNLYAGRSAISFLTGVDVIENKKGSASVFDYGYDINSGSTSLIDYVTLFRTYPSGLSRISPVSATRPWAIDRFRSFFANGSYSYLNKYTLTASARIDQSNLFGVKTNQKSVPLWSAGAKWTINKEKFYHSRFFPYLSLRLTYGYNANLNKGLTALTTVYNAPGGGGINGLPYATIGVPGNPQLKWEKIGIVNLAVDFTIINNILSGTIDYYKKNGTDMIGDATFPTSSGFLSVRGNYSAMKGNGIDLSLNSQLIKSKQFRWDATLLFSFTKDWVTKNAETAGFLEGKPFSSLYGYRWGGLDEKGDPLGYLDGKLSNDYATIIERGGMTPDSMQYIGPSSPRMFGAFRHTFSYNNLSLSFNITYKGSFYYNRSSINYALLNSQGKGHVDFLSRWQKPGDELTTNVPALVLPDYPDFVNRNAFYASSAALFDKADHIRLQDVNISYSFGRKNLGISFIKALDIDLYMNNLGVIWRANKNDIDPDFLEGYPTPKSISFRVRATL